MSAFAPTADSQYDLFQYKLSELPHHYGSQVHLLAEPYLISLLARLCAEETQQPMVNWLLTQIYRGLLQIAVNQEFPLRRSKCRTRMATFHPQEGFYTGPETDPSTKVISVDLARAGTLPSQICYHELHALLPAENLRQDHIGVFRTLSPSQQVIGSTITGHKIGGSCNDAIVLLPDPMGATGGTIDEVLNLYKKQGKPCKTIALHCIVTPEYLKRVTRSHPDLIIYSVRLDRGLSPPEVLKQPLGKNIDQEKGLNSKDYIVPGGGGFGEILNNAFV